MPLRGTGLCVFSCLVTSNEGSFASLELRYNTVYGHEVFLAGMSKTLPIKTIAEAKTLLEKNGGNMTKSQKDLLAKMLCNKLWRDKSHSVLMKVLKHYGF